MPADGYRLSSDANAGTTVLHPSRLANSTGLEGVGLESFTIFGAAVNDLFSSGATPNYRGYSLVHDVDAVEVPVTSELLAGLYGGNPKVQVHCDLWLDSGGRAAIDPSISVDLVTGATISALNYDTTKLTAVASADPEFLGRRVTFTQKDPTKVPSWSTLLFTLQGAGAPWTVTNARSQVFELISAGCEVVNVGFDSILPGGGVPRQSSGGTIVEKANAPYKFPRNGGAVFKIQTGTSLLHETRWTTLRLTLHDPKDKLTAASLKASLYASIPATNPSGGTPAEIRLGPVNAGYRFLDVAFTSVQSATGYVVIDAPILAYLLAYTSTSRPFFSDTTGDDFEVSYDPSRSYTHGWQNGSGLTTFTARGLATEIQVWRGIEYSTHNAFLTEDQRGGPRFDYAWGVPDVSDPLPNTNSVYGHLPHAVRDIDISIVTETSLATLGNTKRGHFSH